MHTDLLWSSSTCQGTCKKKSPPGCGVPRRVPNSAKSEVVFSETCACFTLQTSSFWSTTVWSQVEAVQSSRVLNITKAPVTEPVSEHLCLRGVGSSQNPWLRAKQNPLLFDAAAQERSCSTKPNAAQPFSKGWRALQHKGGHLFGK